MKKSYIFLLLLMVCVQLRAQTVVIDDVTLGNLGTSTLQAFPLEPDQNYSYTQSIYLQSEINQAGTIYSIAYETNGNLINSNEVVVYMAETELAYFADQSVDWLPLTSLTQVYSGTFQVFNNTVVLELDTPFVYSNASNLLIAVDENASGNDSGGSDFVCHNLTYNAENYRAWSRAGAEDIDPAAPGTPAYKSYNRANVELEFTPITCYLPTGLDVSNVQATTVDVSWSSSELTWDYVVQPSGTGNPSSGDIMQAVSTTANIDELTGNTEYEVYVRSNCGDSDVSDWAGPMTFRTGCAAVIDDFSENFNGQESNQITPYCWNTIITTTATGDNPTGKVGNVYNVLTEKWYEMSADEDDTVMLISPNSSVITDGNHRVEFTAKIGDDASATPLFVGTMTDPTDVSTFSVLRTILPTEAYEDYFVNIPVGTDNYFAFKHGTNTTVNQVIYLDNIVVTTQPTCLEVFDLLVSNISSEGCDLSWTVDAEQTQTEWQYVVQPSGTNNPGLGTPLTTDSNPTSVIELLSNTEYEIHVRANCDATGSEGSAMGAWSLPVTFRTGCNAVIDDFSENFDTLPDDLPVPFCWNVISGTTGPTEPAYKVNYSSASQVNTGEAYYHVDLNSDDTFYLVAPQSTVISDGMHRIEFAAKVNSLASAVSTLKVGVMSDPGDAATFVELDSYVLGNSSSNQGNYTLYYVNIPENETHQNLAFKLETTSVSNKQFSIDSIVVTEQPTCFDVLDLVVSNIESDAFDVTIEADYQAQTEWELVVKQTDLNFNPDLETPITVSTLSETIIADSNGGTILPNMPYRIFARANCEAVGSDGSGQSGWFGPIDLLTDCAAFEMNDITFPEMFEGTSNSDIEPCWSVLLSADHSAFWVRYNNAKKYDGDTSAKFYFSSSVATSEYQMLISPPFSDLGTDKQVRFWVYDDDDATLVVGTMSDPLDAATFTEIQRFNNGFTDDFEVAGEDTGDEMADDIWTELTVDFQDYNGVDQYIAFRVIRKSSTWANFYIDTFTYETNSTLSFEEVNQNLFRVYPNPVNNLLYIDGTEVAQLDVYNINGQKVLGFQNVEGGVDVSQLSNGVYFVKIMDVEGNLAVKKLVKE